MKYVAVWSSTSYVYSKVANYFWTHISLEAGVYLFISISFCFCLFFWQSARFQMMKLLCLNVTCKIYQ